VRFGLCALYVLKGHAQCECEEFGDPPLDGLSDADLPLSLLADGLLGETLLRLLSLQVVMSHSSGDKVK